MRVHIPGRVTRRRTSLVAVVATTVALLVAPMSMSAATLTDHSAPLPNVFGWYNSSSVTVQLLATVQDGVSGKGAYVELLKSVECTGDGVSGGLPFTGSYRGDDTVVSVTIQGPTGPTGVQFVCTATFLRTYPTTCVVIFGIEICDPPRQDPDEVTRIYFDTVRLDHTPPIVGAFADQLPNAAGWYRSPTTVDFDGIDHDSGIRSCDENLPIATSSSADVRTLSGHCFNRAGLMGTQTFSYRFDAVPPSLAPTVSPSIVTLGGSATASANATDQHSGVKSQECDPLDTSTPGVHTVECRATDNADNTATATATYSVAYGFSGFAEPVDAAARNVAKAGRIIPLKWRVTDGNGAPITDLTSVSVTAASLSCSVGTSEDAIEEYASGSSGLQNLGDGYYQFNWATPKSYANSCKTMRLDLGDGIAHTATFEFTK